DPFYVTARVAERRRALAARNRSLWALRSGGPNAQGVGTLFRPTSFGNVSARTEKDSPTPVVGEPGYFESGFRGTPFAAWAKATPPATALPIAPLNSGRRCCKVVTPFSVIFV